MKFKMLALSLFWLPTVVLAQALPQGDMPRMEQLFRELPMEAKRLTGPLFWLHGDESKQLLEMYVQKTAESGWPPAASSALLHAFRRASALVPYGTQSESPSRVGREKTRTLDWPDRRSGVSACRSGLGSPRIDWS